MATMTVPTLTLTPADVAHLADTLRPYHAIYGSFFPRSESRGWAAHYLHGLLSPLECTSVEPMVIAQFGANEAAVRGMQQFLTDSTWDDAAILRRHWQEVATDLDDADGMFIVDGSDFPKKGRQSVGVKRQYCGQLGKIANCQAGVFLAYTSPQGTTLLDRRLYLPQEWVDDPAFAARRQTCHVPEDIRFQTKNELALAMLQDVVASQALHARWFLADAAFGRDTVLRDAVDALRLWSMVEVPIDTPVWLDGATQATTAHDQFTALPPTAWTRQMVGDGTKGPRITEAHVQRVQAQRAGRAGPTVWLILRVDPESGEQKAFLSNAPEPITPTRLITVTGLRWPIEGCFEVGKQDLGMGDYEVRSWTGWHHHLTLVILAHFFLVRLHCGLKKKSPAEPGPGLHAAQRPAAGTPAHAGHRPDADCVLPPAACGCTGRPPPSYRTLDQKYGRTHWPRDPAACPAGAGLTVVCTHLGSSRCSTRVRDSPSRS